MSSVTFEPTNASMSDQLRAMYRGHLCRKREQLAEFSGRVKWSTPDFPVELLAFIGLNDYSGSPITEEQREKIDRGVRQLRAEWPHAYETIVNGAPFIVKVARPSGPPIGTATYLEYLDCTFITDWAFNFLPPKTILPRNQLYGIQENLYHESLHYRVYRRIVREDIFDRSISTFENGSVYIPWHDTQWPVEQAIQAYYVYERVLPMRRRLAEDARQSSVLRKQLAYACEEAEFALESLANEIGRTAPTLNPKIQALWADVFASKDIS
jgi:hypothetical protein